MGRKAGLNMFLTFKAIKYVLHVSMASSESIQSNTSPRGICGCQPIPVGIHLLIVNRVCEYLFQKDTTNGSQAGEGFQSVQ